MTALALREDQTAWDDAQIAVLRSTGIDEDVTPPELQAFLHECQRRRLDPFTRQIYLLGRWDNQKRRKVYRSQTSIDGFRLIARRAADSAHESIENEDTLWCGPDGKWRDVWLEDAPPSACKFVVLRNGKRFPAVARYSGYVQLNKQGDPMGLWRKMPDNQVAKCAEALALRKAFPEELGSLYTDDEMAQADNPNGVHVQAHVVRDEPQATDQAWLDEISERATRVGEDDYAALWRDASEGHREGKCTEPEMKQVQSLIAARMEDVRKAAQQGAEAIEGVIVPDAPLAPEDSWATAVEDITSEEDAAAARADLRTSMKNGSIASDRFQQVLAAIDARLASLGSAVAA